MEPPPSRRVQEMTQEFLNTPLGAQNDSMNAHLRQKDPDAMMLNLGMPLTDGGRAIASGSRGGDDRLPLSSGGGLPLPSPPASSPALLHEGEAAAVAAGGEGEREGGIGGVATHETAPGGDTPQESHRTSSLPSESSHPPGLYGPVLTLPRHPSDLPPFPLSAMASDYGGGPTAAPAGAAAAAASVGLARRGGGATAAPAREFNLLVRTLGAHKRLDEARARVLPEMRRRGIAPDENTFAALLSGAAAERSPDAAEEVGGILWVYVLALRVGC